MSHVLIYRKCDACGFMNQWSIEKGTRAHVVCVKCGERTEVSEHKSKPSRVVAAKRI